MDPSAFIFLTGLAGGPGLAAAPDISAPFPVSHGVGDVAETEEREVAPVTFSPPRETRWGTFSVLGTRGVEAVERVRDPEDEIDALYRKLDRALAGGADPRDGEAQALLVELRDRQEAEADRIVAVLEAALAMPVDAGASALARADALLGSYEDPSAPDGTGDGADR